VLTNTLVAIDPRNGVVKRELSLKKLGVKWRGNDTPNGIAYHASHIGPLSLLVTGKNWDSLYTLTISRISFIFTRKFQKRCELEVNLHSAEDLCGVRLNSDAAICPLAPITPCWSGPSPSSSPDAKPENRHELLVVPGGFIDQSVTFVAAALIMLSVCVLVRARRRKREEK